jgi:hypothetical protein
MGSADANNRDWNARQNASIIHSDGRDDIRPVPQDVMQKSSKFPTNWLNCYLIVTLLLD